MKRKQGRPKKTKGRKDFVLRIRVTKEQMDTLQYFQKIYDKPKSEIIRGFLDLVRDKEAAKLEQTALKYDKKDKKIYAIYKFFDPILEKPVYEKKVFIDLEKTPMENPKEFVAEFNKKS